MTAYVAGDRRAFEQLFARLAPRVHGFFLRSFSSSAMADDLLQITFLKLHRARAEWRQDAPLRPWLFTIASRVRLDELRKRYALAEDAGEEELERADDKRSQEHERSSVSALEKLEQGELAAAVQAAIARLPESQRTVVHLHRYEGMTLGEVAKVLGTTEGAVKLRAFRAYEKLREELRSLVTEEAS